MDSQFADAGRPVAVVTGGGTGIGAASVRRLAERGYDVLINYSRSREPAEALAAEVAGAGGDALAMAGDVAEDADCRALAAAAVARWGRLDALVCSAAVTQFAPMSDLEAQTAADFQRIYAVNVIGAYQMARAAQPALAASPAGAIVFISSTASQTGIGSSFAYAASKGALNTLTVALARNLAPVRVNAVLPGGIDGEWLRKGLGDEAFEATRRAVAGAAALGKMSTPDDIARIVTALVCDAPVITGQLITADAGSGIGRGNLVRP